MINMKLNLNFSLWESNADGSIRKRGVCFESINTLAQMKSDESVSTFLRQLNGFYALVWESESAYYAAVDHIRSIPLFYALKESTLYLSDDAEWIRLQVGNENMGKLAKEEFLLAGYVTGQDTLFPDVKQLQAGEFLKIEKSEKPAEVSTNRHYRFLHNEPDLYCEEELKRQLEAVTLNAIKRLIQYSQGRQLVVPLSGGYDSRLIVTLLKRLGYENVLCFTYGVPGNKEAEYSRKVAKTLGFSWVFIEYSAERWRETWSNQLAKEYQKMAANHSSLPHVQDWLAVKELLDKKFISVDSIVVPGHAGDFVAGSHIPDCVFKKSKLNEHELINELIQKHMSNVPKERTLDLKENVLSNRLKDRIGMSFDCSPVEFANLFELWDWQERQSKYIVNSVRAYEYFNLEWYLPLWDLDFTKFWEGIPLKLRKERAWFNKWIEEQYSEFDKDSVLRKNLGNAADHPRYIKKLIKVSKKIPAPLRDILRESWRTKKAEKHFLGFEGLVTSGNLRKYLKKKYNFIGIFSELYLNSKW